MTAGTISNLWCRVKIAATANSTVVLRKNSANGNETFSIGANTTGAFSDATDTDLTASGDKIAVGITPGGTALVITIIAATFTPTNMSNTVTHMLSFQDEFSANCHWYLLFNTIWSYSIQNIIV